MDDEKIVELFLQRREDGIAALQEKYGAAVSAICMNILHNREDAEECAGDAYLAVWNRVPPEKPRDLRAYLLRIARNAALNRYRYNNASKRGSAVDLEQIEEIIPYGATVEDEIEQNELRTILNDWLGTLNKRDLYIFLHRYWYMDDVLTVAKNLGVSRRTVYVRLEKLKTELLVFLAQRNAVTFAFDERGKRS